MNGATDWVNRENFFLFAKKKEKKSLNE